MKIARLLQRGMSCRPLRPLPSEQPVHGGHSSIRCAGPTTERMGRIAAGVTALSPGRTGCLAQHYQMIFVRLRLRSRGTSARLNRGRLKDDLGRASPRLPNPLQSRRHEAARSGVDRSGARTGIAETVSTST